MPAPPRNYARNQFIVPLGRAPLRIDWSCARVAKPADATDLKSVFSQEECGFNSHPGHQSIQPFRATVTIGSFYAVLGYCHHIVTVTVFLRLGDVRVQTPRGVMKVSFGNDVVAIKHRSCLVSADRHRNPFGDSRANQIAYTGPPQVVEQTARLAFFID